MERKTIKLSEKEREEIFISLSIRCGFLETNTIYRAIDMEKAGQKDTIRVLSTEQMRMIVFLEDLMKKIF